MAIILIIGKQGSGKSTLAYRLSKCYPNRQLHIYDHWGEEGPLQENPDSPNFEAAIADQDIIAALCFQGTPTDIKQGELDYAGTPDMQIVINTTSVF